MRKLVIICLSCIAFIWAMQACHQKQVKSNVKGFEFKEKLSDYDFFQGNIVKLKPNSNLISYDLATPLFTDYTIKDRFIVLPSGKTIKYVDDEELDFPDSTIIVKNFSYRRPDDKIIHIETRLLVKDPIDGNWKVMNYLWNEEQTEAVKYIRGAALPITLKDEKGQIHKTNYMVPNTNDCKRCHIRNSKLIPIGPKARNMNYTRQGQLDNQLALLIKNGHLTGVSDVKTIQVLPNWTDNLNFTVNERARAYLDVNCAHCHREGGDAFNTGLFLTYNEHDTVRLGYFKGPVSAGSGAGGMDFDLVPGNPDRSILYYRMNSDEPGTAMPELARTMIHTEGIALIRKWIEELK